MNSVFIIMIPYFSIIIPTLNEEKSLPILLESIKKQTFPDFEIFIGDSNSKDKTQQIAKDYKKYFPHLFFVDAKAKSLCQARNKGAEIAKGIYFIFLDADTKIAPDFLEGIKNHLQKDHPDALTVLNRIDNNSFNGKIILGLLNLAMVLFQKIKPAAHGPCIIISKELFTKINGFDETIFFGEDFDIIQRAVKLGAKFTVYKNPTLYVSTRRFDQDGLFISLKKSLTAILYRLFIGPIRKPIFEYEMGGQYYKKK